MACALTSGRTEPCKDSVGGIKAAWFIDYIEDAFTVSGGQATAINGSITDVYKYDLRSSNNTLSESVVSDKNTGVTLNTQTLELRLKKQDYSTSAEIKLMANARPIIVVQGYDNTYKAVGHTDGCDLTASNIQSGGAKSDFNGYDLTFTAEEVMLAPFLDSSTVTALEALESATLINP